MASPDREPACREGVEDLLRQQIARARDLQRGRSSHVRRSWEIQEEEEEEEEEEEQQGEGEGEEDRTCAPPCTFV